MRPSSQPQILAVLALLLSVSFFGTTCSAYAQEAPQPETDTEPPLRRTWVRPAIAASTLGGSFGVFSVQHQRGANLLSARVAATGIRNLYGKTGAEVGILYGRAFSWAWGNASASAGVAFLGSSEVRDNAVPGLPAQAKVYASVPYTPFGLSLGGTANLNTERSFAGITFGVVIGDLR